jgi:hypothetical protein
MVHRYHILSKIFKTSLLSFIARPDIKKLYPITPQKLLKSLDLVVYIENGWNLAILHSMFYYMFIEIKNV